MKRVGKVAILSAALGLSALVSRGDVHTNAFVAGATDLSNPASYDDGVVPGAGDVVFLSNGTVRVTAGTAGWTTLTGLSRVICVGDKSARLEITVMDNSVDYTVPTTARNFLPESDHPWEYGGIVKKGSGTLNLKSADRTGFTTVLEIEAGRLAFMPQVTTASSCGHVTVSKNAVFDMVPFGNNQAFYIYGISGEGMVTNSAARDLICNIENNRAKGLEGSLRGPAGGQIQFRWADGAIQEFWYPANTFTLGIWTGYERAGAYSIGSDVASSLGPGTIRLDDLSLLEYLGPGETSTKSFTLAGGSNGMALSAGTNGTLICNGNLTSISDKHQRFTLTGQEATTATFGGNTPKDWISTGVQHTLSFSKEGKGTWRMAEAKDRLHAGGLAVFDGVLEFDSVEEAGRISSLGIGTNLTDNYAGPWTDNSHRVDYFLTLGARKTGESPVFKFTGTNSQTCCTRPIRMVGDGTFRNDGPALIRWVGVTPDAGSHTLTLDGTGVKTNEVADLTDGTSGGTLSVCKKGSGTWAIGGDTTFSGTLDVEAGKLIVRKIEPGPYTWFRWTWRQFGFNSERGNSPNIGELVLCDAGDVRQNRGLVEGANYAELQPGEAAMGSQYGYAYQASRPQTVGALFDGNGAAWGGFFGIYIYKPNSTEALQADPGNPATWASVVMRLTNGTPEIATWDIYNRFADYQASVTDSKWEGSVDGLHWEFADDQTADDLDKDCNRSNFHWAMAGTRPNLQSAGSATHLNGRAFQKTRSTRTYSVLNGVSSISVAAGATLEAEGNVALPKLSVSANGGGTVRGFKIPEDGELVISDWPAKTPVIELPVTFDVTDLGNITKWSVTATDKPKAEVRLSVRNGKVYADRSKGLVLIVR